MKVSSALVVVGALALAGCAGSGGGGGGGGGAGGGGGTGGGGGGNGSGGGGTGAVAGTGTTAGAGFTGTANMKGVVIQSDKNAQVTIPVPGAPTIYESSAYPYIDTGPNQTTTNTTAVLDLDGVTIDSPTGRPLQASGTGSIDVAGNIPGVSGTGSSGLGQALFTSTGDPNTAGDQFTIEADDLNNDGTDDFFMVQLGAGSLNSLSARSTTGVFYGGTFTPESALPSQTATFSRTDGAVVTTVTGTSITGGQAVDASVRADVTLTADFGAGTVDGRLTGVGRGGGANGSGTSTDIILSGATINGGDFTGGTARMVNGNTAVYANGATSDFSGSFMGDAAEAAAGTALITGNIGGEQAATTAVFVGDRQP
ncbi:hypothetical protein [Pseudaestuariivita sp.]|uniref:hypothetical protein n=1 Tax=Pseudaestuariivita sp. TaxID=2211669 RepID=UPI004059372E